MSTPIPLLINTWLETFWGPLLRVRPSTVPSAWRTRFGVAKSTGRAAASREDIQSILLLEKSYVIYNAFLMYMIKLHRMRSTLSWSVQAIYLSPSTSIYRCIYSSILHLSIYLFLLKLKPFIYRKEKQTKHIHHTSASMCLQDLGLYACVGDEDPSSNQNQKYQHAITRLESQCWPLSVRTPSSK